MDREKRLAYLDIAKAITIICVVIGHIPICPNIIRRIIYAFHMPCFFSLAGCAWNSKENSKITGEFVKKKAERLLVPCIVWGLFYAFPFSSKTIIMIYGSQKAFISAQSLSSLWYLPCFYIAICFFKEILYCVKKINNPKKEYKKLVFIQLMAVSVSFILGRIKIKQGYPWSLDVAIMSIFFIIFGYILRNYYKKDWLSSFKMVLFIIFSSGVLYFCTIWNLRFLDINNVDMASSSYGNLMLFLISGCIGTTIVIVVGILIERFTKRLSKVLSIVGRNTMIIFLVHKPVVLNLNNMIVINGMGGKILAIISYTIIAISFGCVLALFLGKYLPWTIGNRTHYMEKENG